MSDIEMTTEEIKDRIERTKLLIEHAKLRVELMKLNSDIASRCVLSPGVNLDGLCGTPTYNYAYTRSIRD